MLQYESIEDQPLSSDIGTQTWLDAWLSSRQRSAGQNCAGPKGAPPAIPPIIINPFNYQQPEPAIDPRKPPPSPPVMPPPRPAMSLC